MGSLWRLAIARVSEARLGPAKRMSLGREPIKPEALANVRFGTHNGHKSDIAACPKSADFVAEVCDDDGKDRERGR
jgi:hypothetical protein